MQVRHEVHELLRVDGHVVDDLADGGLLARLVGKAQRLAVDGSDNGRAHAHASHERAVKVLVQQ